VNFSFFLSFATRRMRSSACDAYLALRPARALLARIPLIFGSGGTKPLAICSPLNRTARGAPARPAQILGQTAGTQGNFPT
jgi:hypothetical protein